MTQRFLSDSDRELIKKGYEAEKRERGELIDNLYRSGAIPNYLDYVKKMSTEQLRKMYTERLKELGYSK